MKEEDIDNRIERVIESVGAKKAAMRQWETDRLTHEAKRRFPAGKWRKYGISAAASIIVICGIGLGILLNKPADAEPGDTSLPPVSQPAYRGGSSDIDEISAMIDSARFDEALQAIDANLADTVIDPEFTIERQQYLRELNAARAYQLTWMKIDVLIRSDKKAEAISLLRQFADEEGDHQEEAKNILNELTE